MTTNSNRRTNVIGGDLVPAYNDDRKFEDLTFKERFREESLRYNPKMYSQNRNAFRPAIHESPDELHPSSKKGGDSRSTGHNN